MSVEPEQVLEDRMVDNLVDLGYEHITIENEQKFQFNLKLQIENLNSIELTDSEFEKILIHLEGGNVFRKAKTLRERFRIKLVNGENAWIKFIDSENILKNKFQVLQQYSNSNVYKNRYDVTILINGLPLVHCELKRKGVELKTAFNQINRYQQQTFNMKGSFYGYVQIFLISNGVNTKYYANNKIQSFKQTFTWADENNININQLEEFINSFLPREQIFDMISNFTVLSEAEKVIKVLRPYQVHAVKNIYEHILNTDKNGYIWHTTGSGKTLTSYKISQLLTSMPEIKKVIFVVDRKDLDFKTTTEFNSFSEGAIDGTDNTKILVKQLSDDTKLIVTTLQKLNSAIVNKKYHKAIDYLKKDKVVFIFDECHRSQFGDIHKRIKKFFSNNQMIGFTGTPIFKKNSISKNMPGKTTEELFDKCLHKYTIIDAIRDDNVLRFAIEYVGKYVNKERNNYDPKVENIDTSELLNNPENKEKIVNFIISNHDRKTHSKNFNSIFATDSVNSAIQYYELFKSKKDSGEHALNVATIFSFQANEEDISADGIHYIDGKINNEENSVTSSREKLDQFIEDYNNLFNTNFTTSKNNGFYLYSNHVSKKVRSRDVDILIVVDMFITGFDSPMVNTLYLDKNLTYHNLLQAFSRTNRIVNEKKSHGNIVTFRNLKKSVDETFTLFADKDRKDEIIIKTYTEYVDDFNEKLDELISLSPSVQSIDLLIDENDQKSFITIFRNLINLNNILSSFIEFKNEDLNISEQLFEDYKSKYLDLYDLTRNNKLLEKESILNDIDFVVELIQRDEINISYILTLIDEALSDHGSLTKDTISNINNLVSTNPFLRFKSELINEFIEKCIDGLDGEIQEEFDNFVIQKKEESLEKISNDYSIKKDGFTDLLDNFLYTNRIPITDDFVDILIEKPKILERREIANTIRNVFIDFTDTYLTA